MGQKLDYPCVKTRAFQKALKAYPNARLEIEELAQYILDDPSLGELFHASCFAGIRHAKHHRLGQNYAIYYAECGEASYLRNGIRCPGCKTSDCPICEPGTIVLLDFATHKKTDKIR